MIFEKTFVTYKPVVMTVVKFATLLSVAVFAPLVHNQLITGSLVNATLFVAAGTIGLGAAVLLGLLPSVYALLAGTLPAVAAPMLPFIMLSNILLVLIFSSFSKYNFWLRMFSAAFLKFIFLFSFSYLMVNFLFIGRMSGLVLTMFSWPQLITAIIGGGIAFVVLKNPKKV